MILSLYDRLRRSARAAASAFLGRDDGSPASVLEEGDLEVRLKIETRRHADYVDAVGKFERQRDEDWKEPFGAQWPQHRNAQLILERHLQAARRAIVLLSNLGAIDVEGLGGQPLDAGAPPVGLAADYAVQMTALVAAQPPPTDGQAALVHILSGLPSEPASEERLVLLRHENDRLFTLIRQIEAERDSWLGAFKRQGELHAEHQERLVNALTCERSFLSDALLLVKDKLTSAQLAAVVEAAAAS